MGLKLKNDAASRLASNISSADTSILLTPGSGVLFPILSSGDYFPATLIKVDGSREIVKVTARSSDILTVERAKEGTVAQGFNANDKIELRLTAGIVESINTLVNAALPRSGGTMTGDLVLSGDPTENLEAATKSYVDAKDASRKTYIDAADTALANADTALANAVSAEATARSNADTALSGAISAEATARANADAAEVIARNNAIATVVAALPPTQTIGNTWQSFDSNQRAERVTYTNSTGKTIQVSVNFASDGTGAGYGTITINGSEIAFWQSAAHGIPGSYYYVGNMGALIPPGSTYSINASYSSLASWWELR